MTKTAENPYPDQRRVGERSELAKIRVRTDTIVFWIQLVRPWTKHSVQHFDWLRMTRPIIMTKASANWRYTNMVSGNRNVAFVGVENRKLSIEANNLVDLKHSDQEKAVAVHCVFYLVKEPEHYCYPYEAYVCFMQHLQHRKILRSQR